MMQTFKAEEFFHKNFYKPVSAHLQQVTEMCFRTRNASELYQTGTIYVWNMYNDWSEFVPGLNHSCTTDVATLYHSRVQVVSELYSSITTTDKCCSIALLQLYEGWNEVVASLYKSGLQAVPGECEIVPESS